mmetsp:Transcript_12333/g.21626  ORF Transcript_12333/g.21626 Transcript_12333/m.21626 type:complete len:83 (+) Transcript_12333:675-923(+)
MTSRRPDRNDQAEVGVDPEDAPSQAPGAPSQALEGRRKRVEQLLYEKKNETKSVALFMFFMLRGLQLCGDTRLLTKRLRNSF